MKVSIKHRSTPAKRANWIRERRLAKVVLELVARLDSALRAPIEVES